MIKAIIFDYGGVLSEGGKLSFLSFSKQCAVKFNVDPEVFKQTFVEHWNQAKINAIHSSMFWEILGKHLGITKEQIRTDFAGFDRFRHDVFDIVKKLKKQYKLGLLSNHIEDWLEETIENHHLNKTFDVIVTSYKSRKAKPDIRIYKEIVEQLQVKPTECVYIDDLEKNIPPAKELGIHTILFTNLEQLLEELRDLGINI